MFTGCSAIRPWQPESRRRYDRNIVDRKMIGGTSGSSFSCHQSSCQLPLRLFRAPLTSGNGFPPCPPVPLPDAPRIGTARAKAHAKAPRYSSKREALCVFAPLREPFPRAQERDNPTNEGRRRMLPDTCPHGFVGELSHGAGDLRSTLMCWSGDQPTTRGRETSPRHMDQPTTDGPAHNARFSRDYFAGS